MAELNLESSIKRLSEIVKTLEQNDGSLEEALKLFEEGVNLTKRCHEKINQAEKKIEILTKVNETGVETKKFEKP